MVDIGLEPLQGDDVPKDLYLSLRIGEQQKFTKASTSRAYKFEPQVVGERRYAKLEIYKRVGICSMSIDMEKVKGTHDIAVPIDDERGGGEVRYRVHLSPSTGKGQDKPPAKDLGPKVQAAREYLDKHQLEQQLSLAMQAVLRERPEDPATFVAQKLLSGTGMMTKVAEAAKVASVGTAAKPSPSVRIQATCEEAKECPAGAVQEANSVEPMRQMAKERITEALKDGRLGAALQEKAGVDERAVAPAAAPFRPAVPCPEADPIMPMTLIVTPDNIGFASFAGPRMMIF